MGLPDLDEMLEFTDTVVIDRDAKADLEPPETGVEEPPELPDEPG